MARRGTSCMFLQFVWCVTSGILMTVTAQPTVTATILTPVADRKKGGMVHMRCVATNLEEDHIVDWRTENPIKTLRWGNETVAGHDPRLTFETIQTDGMTIQNFNISNLQRGDTDEYVCNVNDPMATGGHDILATDRVTLSVLYFPSQPPMCSPDGPITVDTGSELNMTCSSEADNSAVIMTVSQTPTNTSSNTNQYTWMQSNTDDTLLASINLMVDVADHNASFECIISSTHFPDMERSCTIGPISVTGAEGTMKEPTSNVILPPVTQTDPMTIPKTDPTPSRLPTPVIAGVVTAGGIILIAILVIFVFLRNRKHRRLKNNLTPTDPQVSKADPYTELQKPTGDVNREYTELGGRPVNPANISDSATKHHTYQEVENNEMPERHSYVNPDPRHTEYEVVQVP